MIMIMIIIIMIGAGGGPGGGAGRGRLGRVKLVEVERAHCEPEASSINIAV